jgi:hypothetical protein
MKLAAISSRDFIMITPHSARDRHGDECANGAADEWERYRRAVAAFYAARGHYPRRSSHFPSERRLAEWLEGQPSTHGLVSPADRLRGVLAKVNGPTQE